jgi:hypothetical protein
VYGSVQSAAPHPTSPVTASPAQVGGYSRLTIQQAATALVLQLATACSPAIPFSLADTKQLPELAPLIESSSG